VILLEVADTMCRAWAVAMAVPLAAALAGCGGQPSSPPDGVDAVADLTSTSKAIAATADTWIKSSLPTANFGAGTSLKCGVPHTGITARVLVRFNLGSVPASAEVTSAQLRLRVIAVSSGPTQYKVHRVTKAWTETGANWRKMHGAYDPVPLDSRALGPSQAGSDVAWDVKDAVEYWLAHPAENYGLMVLGPGSGGTMSATFSARESGPWVRRPKLKLTYDVPAGAAAAGPLPSMEHLTYANVTPTSAE
jgi:hypothetical protein